MKRITIQICIFLCLLGNVKATETFYEYLTEPASLGTSGGVNYYTMIDGEVVPTPTSDLILQYLMGANGGNEASYTLDTSGNSYTGTVSGATWNQATNGITDYYGFDGGDYISSGDILDDTNSIIVISSWTYINTKGANGTIFNKGGYASINGIVIYYGSSNDRIYYKGNGVNGNDFQISGAADSALGDTWYHTACLMSQGRQELWINGVLIAVSDKSDNYLDLADDIEWGGFSDQAFGLNGGQTISTIWTNATLEEATNSIVSTNRTQAVELGIADEYIVENHDDECVLDFEGVGLYDDGSKSNTAFTVGGSPVIGGTSDVGWMVLDGSGDYLYMGGKHSPVQFTAMAWINLNSLAGSTYPGIISWGKYGQAGWDFIIDNGNDKLMLGLNTTLLTPSSSTLSTGVWTHVGASYDGTNAILYQDGVVVAQGTHAGPLTAWTSGGAICQRQTTPVAYLGGKITKAITLDRAITTNEFQSIYNSQTNLFGGL